jgi:2-haloacid dehalogenase
MRTVIFDLGSVLIGWRPQLVYQKLVPDPEVRAWFLAEVCRAPWDSRPVRENAFEEGLRRLAARSAGWAELVAAQHDSMLQTMLDNKMPMMAGMLEQLSAQGVQLLAITDLPGKALPQIRQTYPAILGQLTGIVVADEVGIWPPDPAIFEYTLRRFQARAQECLYVDESEANVQAAQSMGIASIQHSSIGPLRRQLRERGYLPPSRWTRDRPA